MFLLLHPLESFENSTQAVKFCWQIKRGQGLQNECCQIEPLQLEDHGNWSGYLHAEKLGDLKNLSEHLVVLMIVLIFFWHVALKTAEINAKLMRAKSRLIKLYKGLSLPP